MSTVLNKEKFAKILELKDIDFNVADFENQALVDGYIEQIVKYTCDGSTFAGAGISRSCFTSRLANCAIKVVKNFYIDPNDEEALYDEVQPFDDLKSILKFSKEDGIDIHQTENEVNFFIEHPELREHLAEVYAYSSNYAVSIMELCFIQDNNGNYDYGEYCDLDRWAHKRGLYDVHEENVGYNQQGKMVILDYGM